MLERAFPGRFTAAEGRGAAGSLDVKSKMGDDRLRFGGTNFIPGFSTEQGLHLVRTLEGA